MISRAGLNDHELKEIVGVLSNNDAMPNVTLDSLVARVADEPRVWVRVATSRPVDEWQLALLEVTLGEPPPRWRRCRWEYGRAVFAASAPNGKTVAGWLKCRRIPRIPLSLPLNLSTLVQVERRHSGFVGTLEPLPWPSDVWTVNVTPHAPGMLQGELVADNAPAFLSFDHAALSVFACSSSSSNRSFSGSELVVRDQDRRGRIDAVRVRPTEVVVDVTGQALGGTTLALGGFEAEKRRLRGSGSRQLRLPLRAALPAGAWIALHKDGALLDRRVLDRAWGQTDVEFEVDARTRVEVLASRGEGDRIEFKRQLPNDPVVSMKTVAAFANGSGGSLLFGVEDDGSLCGLAMSRTRPGDQLSSLIRDWVRPLVDFTVEESVVDGKLIVVVDVAAGSLPPYGVGTRERDVRFFVRRAATTFPASPLDVREAVMARAPTSAQDRWPAIIL